MYYYQYYPDRVCVMYYPYYHYPVNTGYFYYPVNLTADCDCEAVPTEEGDVNDLYNKWRECEANPKPGQICIQLCYDPQVEAGPTSCCWELYCSYRRARDAWYKNWIQGTISTP
ncbi:hypothetical protein J25TS5_54780 [Paenibacillus faecis]|uniref:hypothetical protein n=1 Tax=Paenibacillus faecis TaxID=862114 RepID=UPI001B119D74|nr:hypothetical protein [Paenibacillus faecis]GIO88546.1 hypothetical protein J25TS5_54780 [Paenibacillus faecis]